MASVIVRRRDKRSVLVGAMDVVSNHISIHYCLIKNNHVAVCRCQGHAAIAVRSTLDRATVHDSIVNKH